MAASAGRQGLEGMRRIPVQANQRGNEEAGTPLGYHRAITLPSHVPNQPAALLASRQVRLAGWHWDEQVDCTAHVGHIHVCGGQGTGEPLAKSSCIATAHRTASKAGRWVATSWPADPSAASLPSNDSQAMPPRASR